MKSKKAPLLCGGILLFLSLFPLLFILLFSRGIIILNRTPSLSYGYYIKVGGEIKEGDFVYFPSPLLSGDVKVGDVTFTFSDIPYSGLLKKVKWIKDDEVYVVGNSNEEIKKEVLKYFPSTPPSSLLDVVSFDSTFFSTVPLSSCVKIKYLSFLSSLLNPFIKKSI